MKYAVVKIGGSQYQVQEGKEFVVDRLPQKEGEQVEFPEVLLIVNEDEVKIGQPVVPDFKVRAKVLSHLLGDKVRIARFKAKSRYRKVNGFRPSLTKIKIEGIEMPFEKMAEAEEVKAQAEETPKRRPVVKRKPRTKKIE